MASCNEVPDLANLSGKTEFLNKESTIIVFSDLVTAGDVMQRIKCCIKLKFWPKKNFDFRFMWLSHR